MSGIWEADGGASGQADGGVRHQADDASDAGVDRVGVCSWSLQPTGPDDLADRVTRTGCRLLQLALDPLRTGAWSTERTRAALDRAGVRIVSGMMAMRGEDYSTLASIRRTGGVAVDEHWSANLRAAEANARLARDLDIPLVTFHAGFIPHDADDPTRAKMLDRVAAVAARFAAEGVRVGLETGQETAGTLLSALAALESAGVRRVGVNFDPANMILYGMGDPVGALQALGRRVVQIHVKDAVPASTPGEWGHEVPVGTGSVDWAAFFDAIAGIGLDVDLIIEREVGTDRVSDIVRARDCVASYGRDRRSS